MTNNWSQGTWFITGASSGFGREIARAVLARGGTVIATARRSDALAELVAAAPNRALALNLDVTDALQVTAAAAAAKFRFGRIDVLVNNAGYGLIGSVEETSDADARRLFEVNFFGLVGVTRALLPAMRAQRRGWIVNISSIAGLIAFPGSAFYSASKFAVEGFSESLRNEVAPLGIGVTVVEPGFFRTAFGANAQIRSTGIADYAATVGETAALMTKMGGREPGDPQRAAAVIIEVLDRGDAPPQLVLGASAFSRVGPKLTAQREAIEKMRDDALRADFP